MYVFKSLTGYSDYGGYVVKRDSTYTHNSEMCHPRCVYKLIGSGIKSVTSSNKHH